MKGIQVCSNEEPHPFPRGVNYQIAKINWQYLKILSRTTAPISTKLGIKHPCKKEIQVFSNKDLCSFPRGDNYEIEKIHWQHLKVFFSRIAGPISTKLNTEHLSVKRIQVCSNEGSHPFPRGDNYEIAKISWQIFKIFQNFWANFNQTWHKAFLHEGNSSLFKSRAMLFSKGW